jgi:hypothetical protein
MSEAVKDEERIRERANHSSPFKGELGGGWGHEKVSIERSLV